MPVPTDPPPRVFRVHFPASNGSALHSQLCESAFVTFKPSPEGPAHVVGGDGTYEFGRVHFENGHFQMGQGNDKIGNLSILGAELLPAEGLFLVAHDGRRVFVPREVIQTATFKYKA